MQSPGIRVIKVGGSLLDFYDLSDRLRGWLAAQTTATNILVTGGGRRADLVRARKAELTEREAHWLAIEAMEANARWLFETVVEAKWLDGIARARTIDGASAILSPRRFMWYDDARHACGALPANWQVTSDSIAARVAELAGAKELVLLKSAAPPASATPERLASVGYVDAFFPRASRSLAAIRCVNLRACGA